MRDAVAQCSHLRQDLLQKDNRIAQLEQANARLESEAQQSRQSAEHTEQAMADVSEQLQHEGERSDLLERQLSEAQQQMRSLEFALSTGDKQVASLRETANSELTRYQTENSILQQRLQTEQERASLLEQQARFDNFEPLKCFFFFFLFPFSTKAAFFFISFFFHCLVECLVSSIQLSCCSLSLP